MLSLYECVLVDIASYPNPSYLMLMYRGVCMEG